MRRSRIECEICGGRFDTRGDFSYPRLGAASVLASGLRRCSACRRRGCPSCLRVIEERADDFFFDELLCSSCLRKEEPRCVT